MPRIVIFQGRQQVFPDNATDEQIRAALSGGAQQQQERTWLDSVSDYAKGFWNNMSESGRGMVQAVAHPIEAGKAIVTAQDVPRQKAEEAFKRGDYAEGVRHVMGYLMPLVGPQLDASGDKAQQGNVAEALGETTSTALQLAGPKLLEGVRIPITPRITNPNAAEAAALDYLQSRGVEVPAGARTGNAFVKNIQEGADNTPLGAIVAQRSKANNITALRNEAESLTQRALPEQPAKTYYDTVRQAESDPANVRTVQVGTRQVNAPASTVLDSQGRPATGAGTTSVPVTGKMALPVRVAELRAEAGPIFEEMQWMPAADREASAAYRALQRIMDGPDYIPASEAEVGLSGLKAMARNSTGRAAGVAKYLVPKLQRMIDNAVSEAGPDVVTALQKGRRAAAAEIGASKLDQIFSKATAEGGFNREAGIWQDWQRNRPQIAKQVSPELVSDLDKFFLGAKKLAENPNPSKTALVGMSIGSGGLIVTNPATGIPVVLGAGALSKLLRSPAGIRLLTDGMSVPLHSPAAAFTAAQIFKLAGQEPRPAGLFATDASEDQTDTPRGLLGSPTTPVVSRGLFGR